MKYIIINEVTAIKEGFRVNCRNGLRYLTIPSFEETGLVKHCFTTRLGGVSEGIYETLNTSLKKEDHKENVYRNLERVCAAVDIDYRRLVASDQTHEDHIHVVTEADLGKGIIRGSDIRGVDALITNVPGIPLITFYADCVPLFFLDMEHQAVGLAHAGWKSTVLKIGQKTLDRMASCYGTKPESCLAGIGPSIEKDCFEVREDTVSLFKTHFDNWQAFIEQADETHYHIDLWEANRMTLLEAGVREENITFSGFCTSCREDLFYSHRRDKGRTGSLSAIIELR